MTRRSGNSVEVYGQARPSRLLRGGPVTRVAVQMQIRGVFTTVTQPLTNSRGIFRVNVNRSGAARARWRLVWQNGDTGEFFTSRVARAGSRLKYRSG